MGWQPSKKEDKTEEKSSSSNKTNNSGNSSGAKNNGNKATSFFKKAGWNPSMMITDANIDRDPEYMALNRFRPMIELGRLLDKGNTALGNTIDKGFDNTLGAYVNQMTGGTVDPRGWLSGENVGTGLDLLEDVALGSLGPAGWTALGIKGIAQNAETFNEAMAGVDAQTGERLTPEQRWMKGITATGNAGLMMLPGVGGALGKTLGRKGFGKAMRALQEPEEAAFKKGIADLDQKVIKNQQNYVDKMDEIANSDEALKYDYLANGNRPPKAQQLTDDEAVETLYQKFLKDNNIDIDNIKNPDQVRINFENTLTPADIKAAKQLAPDMIDDFEKELLKRATTKNDELYNAAYKKAWNKMYQAELSRIKRMNQHYNSLKGKQQFVIPKKKQAAAAKQALSKQGIPQSVIGYDKNAELNKILQNIRDEDMAKLGESLKGKRQAALAEHSKGIADMSAKANELRDANKLTSQKDALLQAYFNREIPRGERYRKLLSDRHRNKVLAEANLENEEQMIKEISNILKDSKSADEFIQSIRANPYMDEYLTDLLGETRLNSKRAKTILDKIRKGFEPDEDVADFGKILEEQASSFDDAATKLGRGALAKKAVRGPLGQGLLNTVVGSANYMAENGDDARFWSSIAQDPATFALMLAANAVGSKKASRLMPGIRGFNQRGLYAGQTAVPSKLPFMLANAGQYGSSVQNREELVDNEGNVRPGMRDALDNVMDRWQYQRGYYE